MSLISYKQNKLFYAVYLHYISSPYFSYVHTSHPHNPHLGPEHSPVRPPSVVTCGGSARGDGHCLMSCGHHPAPSSVNCNVRCT